MMERTGTSLVNIYGVPAKSVRTHSEDINRFLKIGKKVWEAFETYHTIHAGLASGHRQAWFAQDLKTGELLLMAITTNLQFAQGRKEWRIEYIMGHDLLKRPKVIQAFKERMTEVALAGGCDSVTIDARPSLGPMLKKAGMTKIAEVYSFRVGGKGVH